MGVFHINLTSWFQIRPPFGDLRRENGHFCILKGIYKGRMGCFYALKLLKMSQYTFGVVWNTLKIISEWKNFSPFLLYTWKCVQISKKSKSNFLHSATILFRISALNHKMNSMLKQFCFYKWLLLKNLIDQLPNIEHFLVVEDKLVSHVVDIMTKLNQQVQDIQKIE